MTIRQILTEPDPQLRIKSKPVQKVDAEIKKLMKDMLDTMYAAPGIGLAAVQIGVHKRVIVIDIAKEPEPNNPMYFVNPEDLLIGSLVSRIKANSVKEVILATSATIEGQTTAHYIKDSIKNLNVKVTKLAHGLPVGGEIEYLDDGTLFSAFKYRSSLNSD